MQFFTGPAGNGPACSIGATALPRWRANSRAAAYKQVRGPKLAIVIDDMGLMAADSRAVLSALPAAVTLAFVPFGRATPELAPEAAAKGHELLVHVPMEPLAAPDPSHAIEPDILTVGDDAATIETKLARHLAPIASLAVGVNNHKGSRFTAWNEGMRTVLAAVEREGLFFLDSRTIAPTATEASAAGLSVLILKRDLFLDHDPDPAHVEEQLQKVVALARANGSAIAIGHPFASTTAVLRTRLPALDATLVPITCLLPAGR